MSRVFILEIGGYEARTIAVTSSRERAEEILTVAKGVAGDYHLPGLEPEPALGQETAFAQIHEFELDDLPAFLKRRFYRGTLWPAAGNQLGVCLEKFELHDENLNRSVVKEKTVQGNDVYMVHVEATTLEEARRTTLEKINAFIAWEEEAGRKTGA